MNSQCEYGKAALADKPINEAIDHRDVALGASRKRDASAHGGFPRPA